MFYGLELLIVFLWNQFFGRLEQGSFIFENNLFVCNYFVFFVYVLNVNENKLLLMFVVVVVLG